MNTYKNLKIKAFINADIDLINAWLYDEICSIASKCFIPVLRNKSKVQTDKDIVQQVMNTYFRYSFSKNNWWNSEVEVSNSKKDKLKADFTKNNNKCKVQIEVEFWNSASCYRDYFKFMLAYKNEKADVWVLIVPTYAIAQRIDSWVSFYEKVIRELEQTKLILTIPILVIWISWWDELDLLKEEFDSSHKFNTNDSKLKQIELIKKYLGHVN